MKQGKIISIMLTILNLILIVLCVCFYVNSDRTEPKVEFQATDIVYYEGMETSGLLQGMTAYDTNDGDVTDRIVIEKMIPDEENQSVVVFYAVSDKAGNAAKFSREFPAKFSESVQTDREEETVDATRLMEAGVIAELEMGNVSESPSPTEEPTASPVTSPTPTVEPTPEQPSDPAPEQPSDSVSEQAEEPRVVAQPVQNPTVTSQEGAPMLVLKMASVEVNRGQKPAWVNLIETLRDDKDSYETLFSHLSVSKYNINEPGTYQVMVQTEDSDGNKSQAVPLTIVVK